MKVGEIWESKNQYKEKVRINYIDGFPEDNSVEEYVGYTYLEEPVDPFQDETEEMILRSWFVTKFSKCRCCP